jgi:predicted enzyme related to lactoylglutathione lyase
MSQVKFLVNIDVPDLGRASEFYTGAFGFDVGRNLGSTGVELLGGGVPVYLLLKPESTPAFSGAATPRAYSRHWTPVHLDIVVSELEVALERAERGGAQRESEILEGTWGRMVLLSDPFGNGVCLVQMSERGYDALV